MKRLPPDPQSPPAFVKTLGGVADTARIRLLRLMAARELGVSDLCEAVQLPQSTVSRHLKILSEEGWVAHRREGTSHLYKMEAPAGVHAGLWEAIRLASDEWKEVAQDAKRLEAALRRRSGRHFIAGSAAQWQAMREEAYGRLFPLEAALGLLPRDWVVADLGCASGLLVANLARHVKKVVGVDHDADMLKAAEAHCQELKNVDIVQGDLQQLPLKEAQFDAALLVLVLAWIEDPAKALAEAARVLKPGGKLVVVDIQHHDRADFYRSMRQRHMGFDEKTMLAWLKKAGLNDAKVQAIPHDPEAKGPALLLAVGMK